MSTLLATKQDILLVKQEILAVREDFRHYERLTSTRFEALESRMALMIENLESRLLIKLGALMTGLFALAATILSILR